MGLLSSLSLGDRLATEHALETHFNAQGSDARKKSKVVIHKGLSFFEKFRGLGRTRHNPLDPYQVDVLPWIEYDRITTANAATTATKLQFFTTQIGGAKTEIDTSMTESQTLQNPETLNITHHGFWFETQTTKADIEGMLNAYIARLVIGKKDYAVGPLICYPGGVGISGETTQTAESWYQMGAGAMHDMWDDRLPAGLDLGPARDGGRIITNGIIGQVVGQREAFHLNLQADTGIVVDSNPLRIRAIVKGIKVRGVR